MSKNLFTVYILYSAVVDRYFVGFTTQFKRQLERHNGGENAHTKSGIPWKAVLKESYESKKEAHLRLQELRGSSDRSELATAIRSHNNEIKPG
jgi:predicted GIY-YIG superfamily endonuclease